MPGVSRTVKKNIFDGNYFRPLAIFHVEEARIYPGKLEVVNTFELIFRKQRCLQESFRTAKWLNLTTQSDSGLVVCSLKRYISSRNKKEKRRERNKPVSRISCPAPESKIVTVLFVRMKLTYLHERYSRDTQGDTRHTVARLRKTCEFSNKGISIDLPISRHIRRTMEASCSR